MFSSRPFVVLVFAFRPMSHLQLIFAYDVRLESSFLFFLDGCPLVPAPFIGGKILYLKSGFASFRFFELLHRFYNYLVNFYFYKAAKSMIIKVNKPIWGQLDI